MLNAIIRFALRQRMIVLALAVLVTGYGSYFAFHLPIDVFPDLNRPRVVVMTEAPGLSPEEVESLITFPIETALNGDNGVEAVRSSSGVGISVIYVEFGFNTDIYNDRQVVNERLQLLQGRLPDDVTPQLDPISSIMGQILMLGMFSKDDATEPLELRTRADWVVRQRLLTIPGVAQVIAMGGGRKQFQILVDPEKLLRFGVSLQQVKDAVVSSNENATGGYLDQQGPNELLVRALGRVQTIEDIEQIVVTIREGRPVTLAQIAKVSAGAQSKRGDSAAFERVKTAGGLEEWAGGSCVVLTINKQPGADTRAVTDNVFKAIEDMSTSLLVSLTVTPALSYLLLGHSKISEHGADGFVLRFLKSIASRIIRFSPAFPQFNLIVVVIGVLISAMFVMNLERDFFPPFNEGSIQLNVVLPPRTSLAASNDIAAKCERRLMQVPDIVRIG